MCHLRKEDGSYYYQSTLVCTRSALFRYFTNELHRNDINILKDPEFNTSNDIGILYLSLVFLYKRANQATDVKYTLRLRL